MLAVSRAPFDTATRQFPNHALALDDLYRIQKRSTTRHQTTCESSYLAWLDEISVKMMGIDVGGVHFRVMFFADFERGKIFIKHISTHAECDKLTDLYRRTKE
ncbi:type II toxin-antitoxin system HigB family toxin [Enterobacter kobei]|uniref:Type II toxin-antitoxin system HigB family toxin n=2 Tax=Enterobacter kobei TaxID=208224 RepID=A0AAW3XM38_9ENTR|nr:type II toxin-antitoxin system HigB family toxin [Enterobacter kobei]KJM96950.1 cytoplasmic protein [Enterobacter kobei]MBC6324903.1 type II toxin-antitoxin system HigB family toxin [Enterobacter kobei]MBG0681657.1 type II toxin-antitoxin system HigB family toxin [Enterobacter kobei]MBW4186451.1 type II toxin-antitoxin system HigB family toxin [Enterobacter kobei]MCQ4351460.1 type II toxin-antitoxin system HigB family toxin [Enterobacter kobei]